MPSPLLIPAIVSAAGAVISSVVNSISSRSAQSSANRVNLQLARETSQQNLDLYQKQMDDYVNYNLPSSQVSRLRDAGINPAMSFGSNGVGSSVMTPSPAPAVAPRVEALNGLDFGIGDAAQTFASIFGDMSLKQAQAESVQKDNLIRDEENRLKLMTLREDLVSKRDNRETSKVQRLLLNRQINQIDKDIEFLSQTFDDRVKALKLNNGYLDLQTQYLEDENVRRNTEVAIKQMEALTKKQMSDAQVYQIHELVRIANDQNMRDWDDHQFKQSLFALDKQLKEVELSDTQRQALLNKVLSDSVMMHTRLKDSSSINKAIEWMYGVGLNDLANAFKDFVTPVKPK